MRPPQPPNAKGLVAELATGVKLHKGGDLAGAEAVYKRVLERAPLHPEALNLMGVIQSEKNNHEAAVELTARAARLRPKDASVLNNYGRALVRARQYEAAIEPLAQAIALAPTIADPYVTIVQAHRAVGQLAEARYYLERLRTRCGGSILADYEHARTLIQMGEREAACASLDAILREHPGFAPGWQALAHVSKAKSGDAIVDGIVAAVEATPEPSPAMRVLCYAAAKVFDDLGAYDRAFGFVLRAKRQDAVQYDEQATRARFKAIGEVFTSRFFEARRGYGVEGERPVFVVGMPRSGTTLAEQIIAAHPRAFGAGELEFAQQLCGASQAYVPTGKFPASALKLSEEGAAALGFTYLRRIAAIDAEAARVVDKMPTNFVLLGFLRLLFADLRVVHCVRHPFDTCLSCFMHDFSEAHDYNQSLEGLASYYTLYRQLMETWSALFGDAIHEFRYEAVVAEQEPRSRALIAFVGLDWDESVLNFAGAERRVATPSAWQVRQPLYASSIGRWKNYETHLLPALSAIPERYL